MPGVLLGLVSFTAPAIASAAAPRPASAAGAAAAAKGGLLDALLRDLEVGLQQKGVAAPASSPWPEACHGLTGSRVHRCLVGAAVCPGARRTASMSASLVE